MNVLVAYPSFPEPDTNAGGQRLLEIVKVLRGASHDVTFLATNDNCPKYRNGLAALGASCAAYVEDGYARSLKEFAEPVSRSPSRIRSPVTSP
jgi:hypothetical protein